MTDQELDDAYTATCRAITDAGHDKTELFLGRLTLLLMLALDDPARIATAIAEARAGLDARPAAQPLQ